MAEPMAVGRLALHISGGVGQVVLSFWPREAPKACRNFIQLCMEGYYEGCQFTRVVPGFMAQSGDPTNTGTGGDSIYDEPFADEISQRLKFNRRGLLGMANRGVKNSNMSQFFITLDATPQLQGRNTIFGCVDVSGASGDTLFNLLKFNEIEIDKTGEKPVYPPVIQRVEIIDNPYDDIIPRITAEERREQVANKTAARKEAKKAAKRKQGVKNQSLLSFDAEPEEAGAAPSTGGKMKSAHDLLDDQRLSKQVKDDRGFSSALPESFADMPSGSSKRSAPTDPPPGRSSKRSKDDSADSEPHPSKSTKKDKQKEQTVPSEADKRKAEIEALQASLLGTRKKDKVAAEEAQAKKKRSAESGAVLLAAQRTAFLESGQAIKGRRRATASASASMHPSRRAMVDEPDDGSMETLKGFKEELREARMAAEAEAKEARRNGLQQPQEPVEEDGQMGYAGEILEEDEGDDNDMSFLSHSLKFRKDVTAERNQLDELVTIDPRAEREARGREFTLDDAKHEEERRRRHGKVPGGSDKSRRYMDDNDRRGSRKSNSNRADGRERDWMGRDVGAEARARDRGRDKDHYDRSPRRPGEGW